MAPGKEHAKHCLVAMPSGSNPEEARWFQGWFTRVIKPAIEMSGYVPVLPPAVDLPQALTPETLSHLTDDSMMVVDLGGATPDAALDPLVMYELGIRHGLGLPVVVMGWKGQQLPFGEAKLAIILEGRALIDLADNRTRLRGNIKAAAEGEFGRPLKEPSSG
jgi:hypothetical protein